MEVELLRLSTLRCLVAVEFCLGRFFVDRVDGLRHLTEEGRGCGEGEGNTLVSRVAVVFLESPMKPNPREKAGRKVAAAPVGFGAFGVEDGGRGGAADPIWTGHADNALTGGSRARQAEPGCHGATTPTNGRFAQIQNHQRESGLKSNLSGYQGRFQVLGSKPEEAVEIDSQLRGVCGIQAVAQVDQSGHVSSGCGGGQS